MEKVLYIVTGAAASGKSKFIADNGLQEIDSESTAAGVKANLGNLKPKIAVQFIDHFQAEKWREIAQSIGYKAVLIQCVNKKLLIECADEREARILTAIQKRLREIKADGEGEAIHAFAEVKIPHKAADLLDWAFIGGEDDPSGTEEVLDLYKYRFHREAVLNNGNEWWGDIDHIFSAGLKALRAEMEA